MPKKNRPPLFQTLERRAFLSCLMLLLGLIFYHNQNRASPQAEIQILTGLVKPPNQGLAQQASFSSSPKKRPAPWVANPSQIAPCPLDINLADSLSLRQIGFSVPATLSILKYRAKGGYFRNLEQLQKNKAIEEGLLDIIGSCLEFKPKAGPLVDLQTASAEELDALPCIGPKTALRIVEYRQALGGFTHAEQIKELYGFRDSTWLCVQHRLSCSPLKLRKLPLNQAEAWELMQHPYLKPLQAKAIVEYRQAHGGRIKTLEELQVIIELDDSLQTFKRIIPYASLD